MRTVQRLVVMIAAVAMLFGTTGCVVVGTGTAVGVVGGVMIVGVVGHEISK